jgi:hypothetical protein
LISATTLTPTAFSSVYTAMLISAMDCWVPRESDRWMPMPSRSRNGVRTSGMVATTPAVVRMPANR